MRWFVYEFLTGGGWWSVDPAAPPSGSLAREGLAMLRAVAEDLSRLGSVHLLRDARCEVPLTHGVIQTVRSAAEERRAFCEQSRAATATVVIAPEFDRHLLTRAEWVEQAGGRLLGPGPEFIALAADKQRTAERLADAGIPVPHGIRLAPPITEVESAPFPISYPAVLKPVDGAGSLGVRLVRSEAEVHGYSRPGVEYRLESFCPGRSASVSVLAGPRGPLILPASAQLLSTEGCFRYLGGETPLGEEDQARAGRLARQVAAAMPAAAGYFGIDLILGADRAGSEDKVIEVNPRITTSYLGLRQIVRPNLGALMWEIACGRPVDWSCAERPVQFAADAFPLDACPGS